MNDDNYDQYIYGDAGKETHDQSYWDDMNKRIKEMNEPVDYAASQSWSSRPHRHISRMPRFSQWYHLPTPKPQLPTVTPAHYEGTLPDGLEVFEASRTYLVDGTQVERLGIKNGDRYVTVVRYDGNNDDMVVLNGRGHHTQTTSDYVNGIVLDELNGE